MSISHFFFRFLFLKYDSKILFFHFPSLWFALTFCSTFRCGTAHVIWVKIGLPVRFRVRRVFKIGQIVFSHEGPVVIFFLVGDISGSDGKLEFTLETF